MDSPKHLLGSSGLWCKNTSWGWASASGGQVGLSEPHMVLLLILLLSWSVQSCVATYSGIQCDSMGIVHLPSPGWLDLWAPKHCGKYPHTVCLFISQPVFKQYSLYIHLQISLCLCLQAMLKYQIFSLCDTTKTCLSLFIHQQTISILCLLRTPLDPQVPPRPICCSQPQQVAEDLVQSSSELFYLTQLSVGMPTVSRNLFSPFIQITLHM